MSGRSPKAPVARTIRLYLAEHPARYRVLTPLTVDCSVLASALFLEPVLERQAREVMRGCELHAPQLLGYEMADVAAKKAARGFGALAAEALASFDVLALTVHAIDFRATLDLAVRYSLTAYDAAYLWLAAELRTPLATFDRRLGEAARRHFAASG